MIRQSRMQGRYSQQWGSDSGRILQIIPCDTELLAVFANEQGEPFTQQVHALALLEGRNGSQVVPITSDGQELFPAIESTNYLGLVENEDEVQNFAYPAQSYARHNRRFGTWQQEGRQGSSQQGFGSRSSRTVYEGGVPPSARSNASGESRPNVS